MYTIPNILGPRAIPSEKCRPTGGTPPKVSSHGVACVIRKANTTYQPAFSYCVALEP